MLNKVILMGRLTADPELRQTPSGVSTCQITVACDRNFVGQGQEKQADFITVVAWRQTAEFIYKYFKKGQEICINGSLQVRKWKDKDGNTRYATDVVVENAEFCGSKNDNSMTNGSVIADENKYELINDDFLGNPMVDTPDLPF